MIKSWDEWGGGKTSASHLRLLTFFSVAYFPRASDDYLVITAARVTDDPTLQHFAAQAKAEQTRRQKL